MELGFKYTLTSSGWRTDGVSHCQVYSSLCPDTTLTRADNVTDRCFQMLSPPAAVVREEFPVSSSGNFSSRTCKANEITVESSVLGLHNANWKLRSA